MRLLWFEVGREPSAYGSGGEPVGGWQDSLERIVRTIPEIELTIVFFSKNNSEVKIVDGVTYIPIYGRWTIKDRVFHKYWDVYAKKILPDSIRIVEEYKPDLIHIFGTEWPWGQIAAHTDVPIVIHIMGSIVPFNNSYYPPNYSFISELCRNWKKPIRLIHIWRERRSRKNNEQWERKIWSLVSHYMGRTQWDESLSRIMHPGRHYFHVEEALREDFLSGENRWKLSPDKKLRLISTGCNSFRKGLDMMLKVAKILMSTGIDFEWQLAGLIPENVRKIVESQEGARFEECHIRVLGFKEPKELMSILCSSTIYVHTAYMENSPNSICEAQCLGLPVVSTNVGGISSLVRHNVDGFLVAANDPWQMADAICELFNDIDRMKFYSENSRSFALARHNDENIKKQLMDCYRQIISASTMNKGE